MTVVNGGAHEEVLINWFNELLLQNGIKPTHFEHNDFVLEYLQRLKSLSEQQNQLISKEEQTINEHIKFLQSQMEETKSIISKLAVEPNDNKLVNSLASIFAFGESKRPSLPTLMDELTRLFEKLQSSQHFLSKSEKFKNQCEELNYRVTGMAEKLQSSLQEFEGWGKRDCELGINELTNATEIINMKRVEYEGRIEKLERDVSGLTTPEETIKSAKGLKAIMEKREQLQDIERSLEPFNKLPPDLSLATLELEKIKRELENLIKQRDALLKNQ